MSGFVVVSLPAHFPLERRAGHGARRNEIGQLLTSDIRKVEGIWTINIDGEIGGGNGKKIKNAASRREVPPASGSREARGPEMGPDSSPGRMFDNCPVEGNGSIGYVSKFVRDQRHQSMRQYL